MTSKFRTADVISDTKSFADLMLPDPLVKALETSGYCTPSPIQQYSVPLGRLGSDLVIHAKSGTGKTVVFAIICFERLQVTNNLPQALILAPNRELAVQTSQVLSKIAGHMPQPALISKFFVGGLPIVDDEKQLRRLCHVAVGTPGRIRALVERRVLKTECIKLFVLDEADSLLGDSFYEDVTQIYDHLPKKKQVLAVSATYTPELLADLEPLMKRYQTVNCAKSGGEVALLGVRQFFQIVESGTGSGDVEGTADGDMLQAKAKQLLRLLASVSFHQAVVFCNRKPSAEWLAQRLTAEGYPAAFLAGGRAQEDRMQAIADVRALRLRVIVSTDVMARGVDLDRVNLVVNLDLPLDSATYMHRVGRTGRFGTLGVSVAILTAEELELLQQYLEEVGAGSSSIQALPEVIPSELYTFELEDQWERDALDGLKAAPKTTPPPSPPSRKLKAQVLDSQEQYQEQYQPQYSEYDHQQHPQPPQEQYQSGLGTGDPSGTSKASGTTSCPPWYQQWYDSQYQSNPHDYYSQLNPQGPGQFSLSWPSHPAAAATSTPSLQQHHHEASTQPAGVQDKPHAFDPAATPVHPLAEVERPQDNTGVLEKGGGLATPSEEEEELVRAATGIVVDGSSNGAQQQLQEGCREGDEEEELDIPLDDGDIDESVVGLLDGLTVEFDGSGAANEVGGRLTGACTTDGGERAAAGEGAEEQEKVQWGGQAQGEQQEWQEYQQQWQQWQQWQDWQRQWEGVGQGRVEGVASPSTSNQQHHQPAGGHGHGGHGWNQSGGYGNGNSGQYWEGYQDGAYQGGQNEYTGKSAGGPPPSDGCPMCRAEQQMQQWQQAYDTWVQGYTSWYEQYSAWYTGSSAG